MAKGPRRKPLSKTSVHKRALKESRRNAPTMPSASDIEVRDLEGNLLRVERTKKPLT